MSADAKKSMGWTLVLVMLGIAAFCAGPQWLALLVPAAILVWYGNTSALRGGRN